MNIQIGDFVKGTPGTRYCITNEDMTRGIVTDISGGRIKVKVLNHTLGKTGTHLVDAEYFEVIGHAKPFDREAVLLILKNGAVKELFDYDLSGANLSRANLSDANLSRADLSDANLSDADLSRANLSGANLSHANLSRSNLNEANLRP